MPVFTSKRDFVQYLCRSHVTDPKA